MLHGSQLKVVSMDDSGMTASQSDSTQTGQMSRISVTEQLIKEIADMVYAMWLRDLKLEEERTGFTKLRSLQKYGGKR